LNKTQDTQSLHSQNTPRLDFLDRWAPAGFVVLWSTGFLAGKAGVADSGPMHFLLVRFVLVALLLLTVALLTRAPWPQSKREVIHIAVAGLLVHASYLGGVFTALRQGVSAGQIAMIVGLQPVLTALCAAWLLKERVGFKRWMGLLTGILGVGLVISPRLAHGLFTAEAELGMPAAFFALFAISIGTVYQKRFCQGMDLRSGGAIQYVVCAAAIALCITPNDPAPIWTLNFILALSWLVLVLSVGAIGLLYRLLAHGEASKVASYFYLVPPLTTLLGMVLFGETLTLASAVGTLLVSVAVALAA